MRNAFLGAVVVVLLVVAGCNPDRQATREMANALADATNAVEAETGNTSFKAVATGTGTPPPLPGTDPWAGRWTGVEGLVLDVAADPAKGAGHYRLTMQYGLDAADKGSFDGTLDGDVIRFTRPDGEQTLRRTDGEATGLRYLAGKSDCLTVKSGEGYCRG